MKSLFFVCLCCSLLFWNCGNRYHKAENSFDAGREFIDACLKGDFDKAQSYLLRNETNNTEFEKLKETYRNKSNDDKMQYHNASINILEDDTISDSVHIINYQNSFDKIGRKVKVLQTRDGWLVDLSYTFNGNL